MIERLQKWKVGKHQTKEVTIGNFTVLENENGDPVAYFANRDDAVLASSSPDMLVACEEALENIEDMTSCRSFQGEGTDEDYTGKLRRAIAKVFNQNEYTGEIRKTVWKIT